MKTWRRLHQTQYRVGCVSSDLARRAVPLMNTWTELQVTTTASSVMTTGGDANIRPGQSHTLGREWHIVGAMASGAESWGRERMWCRILPSAAGPRPQRHPARNRGVGWHRCAACLAVNDGVSGLGNRGVGLGHKRMMVSRLPRPYGCPVVQRGIVGFGETLCRVSNTPHLRTDM